MDRDRVEAIEAFHRDLIKMAGATAPPFRLCGWSSAESQHARFGALLRSVRYTGGSVVDYGCGTGELYAFIQEQGYSCEYIGLDMNDDMLNIARRRHDGQFLCIAPDSDDFPVADYVFASGVFQFRDRIEEKYYARLSSMLFSRCRKGVAVNFLSGLRRASERQADELYLLPYDAINLGCELSTMWTLDHSYHPGQGDMTLGIIKETAATVWKRPNFELIGESDSDDSAFG